MAQLDRGDSITVLETPTLPSSSTPLSPRTTGTTTTTTTTTRKTSNNKQNSTTAVTTTTSSRKNNNDDPVSSYATRPLFMGGRIRNYGPSPVYTSAAETTAITTTNSSTEIRRRVTADDEKGAGVADSPSSTKRQSTTVELAYIDVKDDLEDPRPLKDMKTEVIEKTEITDEYNGHTESHTEFHIRTWTERLHGQRPDRHLFPYRSVKENLHAAKTFLKRFFFLILIIPAWVVPNVLLAKAKHDQDLLTHGNGTSPAESLLMWSAAVEGGATGGEENEIELSKWANLAIFVLNALVMMHLGKAAGVALEELVPKFGASVVSVFDAMTSSSVELAVAAFALHNNNITTVQAAVLGAILNNLLLMLGIAITYGGVFYRQQHLSKETTKTSMNILMLTSIAYIIPVALDSTLYSIYRSTAPHLTDPTELAHQEAAITALVDNHILKMSHGMSIIFLIVYMFCLLYQYHSRSFMVTPEAKHEGPHTVEKRFTHFWFAAVAYLVCLAAQIYSAKLLVHAVESLGHQFNLTDSFVGFILLPIVLIADLQEEVVAIRESKANHVDKAVSLMVGSCMQIGLLVTPILVIIGWGLGIPMTFRFSVMEVTILVGSILIVNNLIADRETNWYEGVILLAIFMLCAIAFYYDGKI